MKNQWVTSIIITAALSIPVSAAVAGGGKKFMRSYDLNADGTVTLEEFNEATANRFDSMDADKNTLISADEFKNYVVDRRLKRQQDRLNKMDVNNDWNITKEEYIAAKLRQAERKFERMDRDQNGAVDANELARIMEKKKRKFDKRGSRMGAFQQMDANQDGNVTQAESQSVWSGWFNRLDLNGDSVVTSDEVSQARSKRRTRE